MYRTGESFPYQLCSECGFLQIAELPTNPEILYGDEYGTLKISSIKQFVRSVAYRATYRGGNLGRWIGATLHFSHMGVMRELRQVSKDVDILDVGSGTGRFLRSLRSMGFNGKLRGVDCFLREALIFPDGVEVLNCNLDEVQGQYDVITLIHVLEHIDDQEAMLRSLARIIRPGGACIIAIPVARGLEIHGLDWVQLDPPRHVGIHSPKSLSILADRCGFKVERTISDSTAFQFWGTDAIKNGYPVAPFWRSLVRASSRIVKDAIRADRLNRVGTGDQATFVLRHGMRHM
jgi:SAM-dependent methyltransferase